MPTPLNTAFDLDLDSAPLNAFIRKRQLVPAVIPVSNATWWRWVKSGYAPAPVKLGPGVTAWRVGDIRKFLAKQVGAR